MSGGSSGCELGCAGYQQILKAKVESFGFEMGKKV